MTDIKVLDKGFVRLEDRMGGDHSVVRAARVSHGSKAKIPEDDRRLIRYLLEHEHGTPFEHNAFTFHVKAPIFVARQWFRHRIGQSYNEVSMRYREAPDEFYIPEKWRAQDTKNKQGSLLSHNSIGTHWKIILDAKCQDAMGTYKQMIDDGIAREMARMVLPVNLYTEWYWTVNARSLMHFIGLRSEQHAQWEIQQYSNALWKIFQEAMPWTATAFLKTLDKKRYSLATSIGKTVQRAGAA